MALGAAYSLSPMTDDALSVLLVDVDAVDVLEGELARAGGFTVERATLDEALARLELGRVNVVVLGLHGSLEPLEAIGGRSPETTVVVATEREDRTLRALGVRAGAEDYLVVDQLAPGLAGHVIRHAAERHRLQRELATLITRDDVSRMWNIRGFLPIAEHQLRWADRIGKPVVLVFVRLDDLEGVAADHGEEAGDQLVADAAAVVREAVRDSDVAARIAPDTFCVLLTGGASGAEVTVLSRLVEAIAVHNAGRADRLSLSVGSAVYDPGHPEPFEQILQTAGRRLSERRSDAR